VLNALLIKDQNLEENSKTYLIMLSLTITRLQGIIAKLMALQKGWFKDARKDFRTFASLGTKRIGTWPYLTSPWVTGCPNTPLCLISLLIFYFLGDIPFHPLPLMFKWTKLWTWTPHPLGLRSSHYTHLKFYTRFKTKAWLSTHPIIPFFSVWPQTFFPLQCTPGWASPIHWPLVYHIAFVANL
jgi:hypothetical protein